MINGVKTCNAKPTNNVTHDQLINIIGFCQKKTFRQLRTPLVGVTSTCLEAGEAFAVVIETFFAGFSRGNSNMRPSSSRRCVSE